MKQIICPGTFDPLTFGHVDIIERGLRIFDKVIVGVSEGFIQKTLFSFQERREMIVENFKDRSEIEVKEFSGLLVDFARKVGVFTILRGLRTVQDFEYEHQMARANQLMDPQLETIFMMTDQRFSHLSSSLIREIVQLHGSVVGMVPLSVESRITKT